MTEIKALKFYRAIETEKDKFKLVNGLFIVEYLNKDKCIFIGNFLKKDSALNRTKSNKVNILLSHNQIFNRKDKTYYNGLGWLPLRIKFIEKPIKDILK